METELEDEREIELEILEDLRRSAVYWDYLGLYLESLDPEGIEYQLWRLEEAMQKSLALARSTIEGMVVLHHNQQAELAARLTKYYPSEITRLRSALQVARCEDKLGMAERILDRLGVDLLEEGPSTDLLRFLMMMVKEEGIPQLQDLFHQLDRLEVDSMADAGEITSRSWLHEELKRRWPLSLGSLGADARGRAMDAILGSARQAREQLIELIEEEIYSAKRRLGLVEEAANGEMRMALGDANGPSEAPDSGRRLLVRGLSSTVRAAHPGLLPMLPSEKGLVGIEEFIGKLESYVDSALFLRQEMSRLFPGSIPRGLILHGPTGVGKTESVKVVARNLRKKGRKVDLYLVPTSSFLASGLGESDKNIERLFQEDLPSLLDGETGLILVFDELDGIARTRSSTSNPLDRILNLLFILIDQVDPHERLLIIGTTNRFELLDPAMIRRLGLAVLYMPPPPQEALRKIWKHFLSQLRSEGLLEDADYGELASCSQGLTGGEIENLICSLLLENSDGLSMGVRLTGAQIKSALTERMAPRVTAALRTQ